MKGLDGRRRTPWQVDARGCIPSLIGAPLADRDGDVVGTVEDVMVAVATQSPTWLLIRLRDVETGRTFVPTAGMRAAGAAVRVPFRAAEIATAPPGATTAGHVMREHAVRLCRHYAIRLPLETWAGDVRAVHAGTPATAAA